MAERSDLIDTTKPRMTQLEVARCVGLTRGGVCLAEQRALEKLRRGLLDSVGPDDPLWLQQLVETELQIEFDRFDALERGRR